MHPTFALTIASLKMYYRNRQAIFWTLVLPLMFIVIFGLLNFGSFSNVDMGVVDEAETPAAAILTGVLEDSEVVELSLGARDAEMQALEDGDRDIVIVIPPGFGDSSCLALQFRPSMPRTGSSRPRSGRELCRESWMR